MEYNETYHSNALESLLYELSFRLMQAGTMASSFNIVEQSLLNPSTTKSVFQRYATKDLAAICNAYNITVGRSGKRGGSIKVDYINAIWKFVSIAPSFKNAIAYRC